MYLKLLALLAVIISQLVSKSYCQKIAGNNMLQLKEFNYNQEQQSVSANSGYMLIMGNNGFVYLVSNARQRDALYEFSCFCKNPGAGDCIIKIIDSDGKQLQCLNQGCGSFCSLVVKEPDTPSISNKGDDLNAFVMNVKWRTVTPGMLKTKALNKTKKAN